MDMDQRTRFGGFGNHGSRIILLSDGTELTHENDDSEMFDQADEERDLDAQVSRGKGDDSDSDQDARNQREGTPAPSSQPQAGAAGTTGAFCLSI
jgi:protein phosphatase PTC2/3